MHDPFDKEICEFLARRMLHCDMKKQREILSFWTELIAGDYEEGVATAGLDSEDKAYVQEVVENWFYSTLLNLVRDLIDAGKNEDEAAAKIKKAVEARVRNIVKDLLFERKRIQKETDRKRTGFKRKKISTAPESLPQGISSRVSLRISHLTPEVQDTVFMDPHADAETQYFFREMLWEEGEELDDALCPPVKKKECGNPADPAKDCIAVFLARRAHLETLRIRLANSKNLENEVLR